MQPRGRYVTMPMNPYQGLKLHKATAKGASWLVTMPMNPYQGLKRKRCSFARQE